MNKRQKKKREKKKILIVADEFNLSTMTDEEREEAWKGYEEFCKRYAYLKKYKDLKENKQLYYSFPPGKASSEWIKNIARRARKNENETPFTHGYIVTQSINDFK